MGRDGEVVASMGGERRGWLPFAAYALLALIPLAPALVGSRDVFLGDLTEFEAPRDRLLASAWRAGEGIPRWAPGVFGGAPALGSAELGLLYPPNLVLALVATDRARAIGLALHLVLAALGARA